ncbi:LRR_1 domain-containing protein/LRR_4 domain-containing protein/LRR_7 domain-containing protein/LRR_6 domain-containing protein/LRR_8 domain-containing protein, partial [Cephalotus follicularis]
CSWGGIACDQDTGHVVSLYLPNNCLHGSINSSNSLFRLVHLQFLTLAKNEFTGSIPYSFANLTKLYKLDLSGNHFFEHIPSSFSHLTHLSILYLDSNQLTGQIPASIRNLTQLSDLDLGYNQLTGQIPASIGNLTQLSNLNLGYNQLTGQIPASIGNLTQLSNLDLGSNQLTGQIPVSIGNLTQLITLDLRSNQLTGQIPVSIRNLTRIEWLVVYDNNLTGELDFEYMFLKLKNLNFLALSFNKLSVISKPTINVTLPKFQILDLASCNLYEFPYFLQNQDELIMLDLSENKLHGQIPKSFWNMSKKTLVYLILDANFLTGFDQLPVVLQRSKLYHLNLANNILQGSLPIPPPSIISYNVSNNRLTGEVSPFFCNLTSISFLDLSNNSLGGILPQCLGNISNSLSVLNLQNNNFHGNIPQASVKGCKLKMINLSQNQLQGNIPGSLAGCDRLEFLNLGNNQIHDIFPSWLGTLVVLKVLILGSNKFCGEIPIDIGNLKGLRLLNISNNILTGHIPSSFENLTQLEALDLSQNKLSGEIPQQLSQLTFLSFLNVSHNRLTGSIPHGKQFDTYQNNSCQLFLFEAPTFLTGFEQLPVVLPWSNLLDMNLANNILQGSLPIPQPSIFTYNVSNNELTGQVSPFFRNTCLTFLDLSNNSLGGMLPQCLHVTLLLVTIHFSSNRFYVEFPKDIGNMKALRLHNISNNILTGHIPSSFVNLTQLEALDLSQNKL